MLKQRAAVHFDSSRPRGKAATVETDASSENNEQSYSGDSDNWFDNESNQQSETVSASTAPRHPSTFSAAANTNGHRGMEFPYQGWTANGLRGHPLVPHTGMHYQGPNPDQGSSQGQRPSYPELNGYYSNARHTPMVYPSNRVRYPAAPDMQGIGVSGTGAQPRPLQHHPANVNGYYSQPYQYQPYTTATFPLTAPQPPPSTPPPPPPPREDPEKIRLEAEIAAMKVMEERYKESKKREESEAKIRSEAEQALKRRMDDMALAQGEAKLEVEKIRLEAEKAARERMEAEKKAEEIRAEEYDLAIAKAEKAAVEKLRIERESEEERSKRFKDFAVNLERELRAKVEMEKRAELAERDAKARQSEDLERLAKLKMLQSMDEIVTLTKKRVLHDLTLDGESEGAKERRGWLIETRTERGTNGSMVWNEDLAGKDQLSIPRSTIPPRHATVSTACSASNASVKLTSASPTPTWKGDHPEAPDPPVLGSESDGDDELTSHRSGTKAFRPSGPDHKNQAYQNRNMFGRQQQEAYYNPESPGIEGLVDRIADAVIERLIHSPYNDLLMHPHPQTSQYYRQHARPGTNPFASSPGPYKRQFGNEGDLKHVPRGPPPCGPSRRFYLPPKPPHLRGRSVGGSERSPSGNQPPHSTPYSQQRIPIPTDKRRSPMLPSPPPPPLPPLGHWLDSSQMSGQFGSQTSHSEVSTVTQEPFRVHRVHISTADGSESMWKHTDSWINEVVPEEEDMSGMRKKFNEVQNSSSHQALLAKKEGRDDFHEAYKYDLRTPSDYRQGS